MTTEYSSSCDKIEITIPSCIEKSMNCLKTTCTTPDVTTVYNISLKNEHNQKLYIVNAQDFRDVLKHYCLYKKVYEIIESDMTDLNLDFHVYENRVQLTNKTKPSSTSRLNCDLGCGKAKVTFDDQKLRSEDSTSGSGAGNIVHNEDLILEMAKDTSALKTNNTRIEIILPSSLVSSIKCLRRSPANDVTCLYNITFKNLDNEQLYVHNEADLHDVLRQYCLFRQFCEVIQLEMKKMNLNFQIYDNKVVLSNEANTNEAKDSQDHQVNSKGVDNTHLNLKCNPDCGKVTKVKFLTPSGRSLVDTITSSLSGDIPYNAFDKDLESFYKVPSEGFSDSGNTDLSSLTYEDRSEVGTDDMSGATAYDVSVMLPDNFSRITEGAEDAETRSGITAVETGTPSIAEAISLSFRSPPDMFPADTPDKTIDFLSKTTDFPGDNNKITVDKIGALVVNRAEIIHPKVLLNTNKFVDASTNTDVIKNKCCVIL